MRARLCDRIVVVDGERENLVSQAFVHLADSLVDEFDVIDLLTVLADRSVQLLDVRAAGILLAEPGGTLRVMAASSEQAHLLELLQLQTNEGPCLDCHATGHPVASEDLAATTRWPQFTARALAEGFQAVYACPMRLRSSVIGALNLFRAERGPLPTADVQLARAFADVATIAIIQSQAIRDAEVRAHQLQHALDSRIVIEQAKGMLAEHGKLDMDRAFQRLRAFARTHNRRLSLVATELVTGELALRVVAGEAAAGAGDTD
jgi:transcriptional regulator with GAF, ATPase, and Fis domain